jgi:ABC-type Mn2+/Zn2+ transport system permease subunit
MITSMLFGTVAVVAGLLVSFHYGTAGGATIAGFSVLEFFIVLAGREAQTALRSSHLSPASA